MQDIANYRVCSGLKEAWEKVHGVKKSIWGAVALFILICAGGTSMLSWLLMASGHILLPKFIEIANGRYEILFVGTTSGSIKFLSLALIYYLAVVSFEMFVILPMRFGALLISLRRSVDRCTSPLFIFKFFHWHYIIRFVWAEVLLMLMIGVPGTLAILATCLKYLYPANPVIGIIAIALSVLFSALTLYLAIAYLFTGQALIDRDVTAWQAMEISRKVISKRWFSIFFTLIWLFIVMFIGTLLFLIGLIWAIPYFFNVIAILYRDMIGIAGKDPVTAKEVMRTRAKA